MRVIACGWALAGALLLASCGDDASTSNQATAGDTSQAGAASAPGGADNSGGGGDQTEAGTGSAQGGAGPQGQLPVFQSGTRLRAIVDRAGDATALRGWHDAELDFECVFREAEDGVMRCLPPSYITAYADDACQDAVVAEQGECAAPRFVIANVGTCGGGVVAFEVGEPVTLTKVYSRSGDECQEMTSTAQLRSTTKLPSSAFVGAEPVLEAKSEALGLSYLQASDGALHPLLPEDLARAGACWPYETTSDYANRCTPASEPSLLAYAGTNPEFFSDQGCSTHAAHFGGCEDDQPHAALVAVAQDDACGPGTIYEYHDVGAEQPSGFQGTPQQCTASAYDVRYYDIGEKIEPAALPEISRVDLGDGRVKARYYSTPQGAPLLFDRFYDSELDFPCTPLPTATSGLRCMPMPTTSGLYVDETCESFAAYVPAPLGNCAEAPPPAYALGDDVVQLACSTQQPLRAYQVGAKLATPAATYYKTSQGCSPSGSDPSGLIFYSMTEIAAEDMAEITRAIE